MANFLEYTILHQVFRYVKPKIRPQTWQQDILKILTSHGLKIKTNKHKNYSLAKLQRYPCLIVCNHPYVIEPGILLASLPKLNNLHLVIRDIFCHHLPHLHNQLLPVNINHLDRSVLDRQKQKRFNQQSIFRASRLLQKKAKIIIFPGVGLQDKSWKSGLGHMLLQANNLSQIQFAPCYIDGITKHTIFRFFPILNQIMPTITVSFGPVTPICSISSSKNPKQLTQDLFEYYQTLYLNK